MIGNWRTTDATVTFVNRATGNSRSFTCQGSLNVTSQTGGEFSGTTSLSGNGYNSDRFCSQSGTLSGTLATGGVIERAVLAPRVGAYQCTFVSGDGTFSGAVSPDGTMHVSTTDIWRCPSNLDGTPTLSQQSEFQRALALSFVVR